MRLHQERKAAFISKCYQRTVAEFEITPWFTGLCSLTGSSSTGVTGTQTELVLDSLITDLELAL